MEITGAQAVIKALEHAWVSRWSSATRAGAILPAYDPILDSPIRHVLARHEQGAGHMAEGYAHATGRVGVAIATSGPGGTNLVTALADAYMDSVPMVAITGQVPRARSAATPSRRPTSPASPCRSPSTTRWSPTPTGSPRHRRGLPHRLDRAARPGAHRHPQGRAQRDAASSSMPDRIHLPGYKPTCGAREDGARGGEGDPRRPAPGHLRRRRHHQGRRARGAAPPRRAARPAGRHHAHGPRRLPRQPPSSCLGMPGMHGHWTAITAMQQADLLIALGARFDDRVTGNLAPSRRTPGSSTSTSTLPRSARTASRTSRSSVTAASSSSRSSRPRDEARARGSPRPT
jgi:acetolactate synthase I/II/III large subunit